MLWQWFPTSMPRSDALEASKILFRFLAFFWFSILASECKVAMILGKKSREHKQILNEDFFYY